MKSIVFIFFGLLVVVQGRTIDEKNVYKPRIVNGEDAQLGERPYQVALVSRGLLSCGGSILNKFWVVTAAHCVQYRQIYPLIISAGTINIRERYSLHEVQKIIKHEDFMSGITTTNDIALIKVVTPFEFSYRIQPVQLPQSHAHIMTNSSAIVSGWGKIDQESFSDILQKTTVFITEPTVCQDLMIEQNLTIYPTQICANDPSTRRGECNGDSGGPVTVNDTLVGIVSWSIKDPTCGSSHYPGIHTRVSEYIDWINRHIQ